MALVAQFFVEEYTVRVIGEPIDREVEVLKDGKVDDCKDCPGKILLMKLSDDGFSFTLVSCAKTQTGQTAYIVTFSAGRLNCTHVQVPEWASFCAAISPSGRSLAYTFFEGYQCNIWVLRRQMGSPQMKVDQLHQQCGYPFSLDDRMISFDLDGSVSL
eukprot:tig00020725_g13548.t1